MDHSPKSIGLMRTQIMSTVKSKTALSAPPLAMKPKSHACGPSMLHLVAGKAWWVCTSRRLISLRLVKKHSPPALRLGQPHFLCLKKNKLALFYGNSGRVLSIQNINLTTAFSAKMSTTMTMLMKSMKNTKKFISLTSLLMPAVSLRAWFTP